MFSDITNSLRRIVLHGPFSYDFSLVRKRYWSFCVLSLLLKDLKLSLMFSDDNSLGIRAWTNWSQLRQFDNKVGNTFAVIVPHSPRNYRDRKLYCPRLSASKRKANFTSNSSKGIIRQLYQIALTNSKPRKKKKIKGLLGC